MGGNQSESLSQLAIQSVREGGTSFCKFLTANDTGLTGGHQYGIYIPKPAVSLIFDGRYQRGENHKRSAKIRWQNDFETESSFTYYGCGSRNEYRITRFGRGFDLFRPDNTGALVVLVKKDEEDYEGWVLETEDEINEFLDYFGMSPTDTNQLIQLNGPDLAQQEELQMDDFIRSMGDEFPKAYDMSAAARNIYNTVYDHTEYIRERPDAELISWNTMEYSLFRRIEEVRYGDRIRDGFSSMQEFVDVANSVLNRRKSRAGKSLEFHLEAIFQGNDLRYEPQVVTEEKKRPDFVFPSGSAYHDSAYPADRLVVLGAKTTCKDRWRQVITEADRVDTKYLCTLQQGISPQQLHEMQSERVVLVVPKPYISQYPTEYQPGILSLATFIEMVREKTA